MADRAEPWSLGPDGTVLRGAVQKGAASNGIGPESHGPSAMAQLVADHHQTLYRYAYRLTGSVPDAEDLTQQVFLIAQQKIEQVRDVESVRGWLFTVLRNCFLKSLRQRVPMPVANTEIDVNSLPDEVLEAPIDSERLQAAVSALAEEFRIVVLMFYFEHHSYRTIAELLKLPQGTVMSRLARAKAHLRRKLIEEPAVYQVPLINKTTANKTGADRVDWVKIPSGKGH